MKRTQIIVILTLPSEDRPTVGDAQDIFDALGTVALRMGADVDIATRGAWGVPGLAGVAKTNPEPVVFR